MSKSITSINRIKEPQVYVKKMIDLTREVVSESFYTGMQLIAKKNDDNNFETIIVTHETDFGYKPKNKTTILISELNFNLLLKLTTTIYRIMGTKIYEPTLIINNFRNDRILVNFQIMGQWNIAVIDLSKEESEIIETSLMSIKENLLVNKKTRIK